MDYQLKYGKDLIPFRLPDKLKIDRLQVTEPEIEYDEQAVIEQALDLPINSQKLEKIVRKGEKTCIVVPDRTRECGAAVFLPLLLNRLNRSGIQDSDIVILMANGSHRINTADERLEILGREILNRIKIIEHDYQNADTLIHLGETAKGTPVYVNRHVVQAERIILTGGVLHHYFAGFGGGPKLVVPGCAACETIVKNHSLTIHPYFHTLHPACYESNMDDNPVHADIRDALKFVPVDFILNVVLDSRGRIYQAYAGELFAAHRMACDAVHKLHSIEFEQPADLVIASASGYPKDLNFIQVHKALHHACAAVKPGGTIILAAKCDDGIGSKTFLQWFDDAPDLASMHANLVQNFKINGNTALALKMKTESARIFFLTQLDETIVKKMGMIPVQSLEAALSAVVPQLPENAHINILPDGSTWLPIPKNGKRQNPEKNFEQLIEKANQFVKEQFSQNTSGHGWWHARRVRNLAQKIAAKEGGNRLIIELAALMHDIVDQKNIEPGKPFQKDLVKDWLRLERLPAEIIVHISEIVDTLSYKGAMVKTEMRTLEGKIVQDADRLDAMGAIGIARTFAYGGEKGRPIFEPAIEPVLHQTAEDYEKRTSTSLNHFYEKLLLLKERMNTPTARKIAEKRHQFLESFLNQFKSEWEGNDIEAER